MGVSVSAHLALIGVFALGMAQMLWTIRSWIGLILGGSFGLVYFFLDRVARQIVAPYRWSQSSLEKSILLVFVIVVCLQSQLPRLSRSGLGMHLYVHARNGFYLNALANRVTAAVWPIRNARETF